MSGEDALATAAAAGDAAALDALESYLRSSDAYTRGRAAELLSTAPDEAIAGRAEAALDLDAASLWWRVLALRAERASGLPAGLSSERIPVWLARLAAVGPSASDAVYQALAAVLAADLDADDVIAAVTAWSRAGDGEVLLLAQTILSRSRSLDPQDGEALLAVHGIARLGALTLATSAGIAGAAAALAAEAARGGPYAFVALEAVEASRDAAAIAPLQRSYSRWFPGSVGARAAASATVLGDADGLRRLRALASSRVRATRAEALLQLARVGDGSDWDLVARAVMAGRDRALPYVVSELWRVEGGRAKGLVLRVLTEGRDPEVRAAACDAAAHWVPDAGVVAALESARAAEQPDVRAAATAALRGAQ
ncbi:MAG: hypothetical protein H6698_04690 [Myxococcales bacterium]|nr:hypothetical protein [Myxococcales bacterium]MCB9530678.1 hypothetical protein [Myxococcales bacterium]MCB9533599.1 hypothetical protein [Myxococcales bacterium]